MLGEKVLSVQRSQFPTEADISNLPAGIYLLQIYSEAGIYQTKVIRE